MNLIRDCYWPARFQILSAWFLGGSKMGVQEEQERRRELLLRALEAYSDPEKALAI